MVYFLLSRRVAGEVVSLLFPHFLPPMPLPFPAFRVRSQNTDYFALIAIVTVGMVV